MKNEVNEKTQIEKIDSACQQYKKVQKSNIEKFYTLGNWLNKESNIFCEETKGNKATFKKLKRGQIVKIDFGINIGSELCFTHFAIVLNKNDSIFSDSISVVPITSKFGNDRISIGKILHKVYPNSLKYNLNCYVNVSQIKTISKTRIFNDSKNFVCDSNILDKIDNEIIKTFTNLTKK